ncbi:hypothetical protein [Scatolibacter rhodanostii]|uniref:hypothetical protein n=1 Tax=Scatolibacter rhodanostii TaxID=2014781 RepID=UPI001356670C|nr:hypothetical protein [Scatolibacter rhodanostii]
MFRLFKRDGKVYTEIIPNAKATALQGIIRTHARSLLFTQTTGVDMMDWPI